MARSTGKQVSTQTILTGELHPSRYVNDPNVVRSLNADLQCVDLLIEQIESLENTVLAQCRLKKPFKALMNMPGIGKILAMTIMLEVGDIDRFSAAGNYASYCRCVESNRYSNGKKKGCNNRKNGNKYLARAYVEAAYFAARFYAKPKAFMEKKTKQVNRTLATKALAHKLSRASYYIMRDDAMYDERKLFA